LVERAGDPIAGMIAEQEERRGRPGIVHCNGWRLVGAEYRR
jgi:hypothetical protein